MVIVTKRVTTTTITTVVTATVEIITVTVITITVDENHLIILVTIGRVNLISVWHNRKK